MLAFSRATRLGHLPQIDTKALGGAMAKEMNKKLAVDGLSATVTATAKDAPATGRRLQQSDGGYGGSYGGRGAACRVSSSSAAEPPKP
jgi:hypothetical protein